MNSKPVIFQPESIRSIFAGNKTQTRRVVKPQPEARDVRPGSFHDGKQMFTLCADGGSNSTLYVKCPYGQPGDLLWVRERWRPMRGYSAWDLLIKYAASSVGNLSDRHIQDGDVDFGDWVFPKPAQRGWVSPLFMPRWASRLTLRITGVRVERLQDITGDDAIEEGIAEEEEIVDFYQTPHGPCDITGDRYKAPGVHGKYDPGLECPVEAFADLWDSINAKPKPVKGADGRVTYYQSFPWDGEKEARTHRGKPWHITPNPWVWVIDFEPLSGNIDQNPEPIRRSA